MTTRKIINLEIVALTLITAALLIPSPGWTGTLIPAPVQAPVKKPELPKLPPAVVIKTPLPAVTLPPVKKPELPKLPPAVTVATPPPAVTPPTVKTTVKPNLPPAVTVATPPPVVTPPTVKATEVPKPAVPPRAKPTPSVPTLVKTPETAAIAVPSALKPVGVKVPANVPAVTGISATPTVKLPPTTQIVPTTPNDSKIPRPTKIPKDASPNSSGAVSDKGGASKARPIGGATGKGSQASGPPGDGSSGSGQAPAKSKGSSPGNERGRSLVRDEIRNNLEGVGIKPEVARDLADRATQPGASGSAKDKIRRIIGAEGDLQLVNVDSDIRRNIIEQVAVANDPSGERTSELVGDAITRQVFGDVTADSVPPEKRGKFREVFTNLLGIQASLELLGGDPSDPEVTDAVTEAAIRGVSTPEEAREIVERKGQEVLDRQGMSAAKPGETLHERLKRIGEMRELEEAAARKVRATPGQGGRPLQAQPGPVGSRFMGRGLGSTVKPGVGGGGRGGGMGAIRGTGVSASSPRGAGGGNSASIKDNTLPAAGGGRIRTGTAPSTGPLPGSSPGTQNAPGTRPADTAIGPNPAISGPASSGVGENQSLTPGNAQINTPAASGPPQNDTNTQGNSNAVVDEPADEIGLRSPGSTSGFRRLDARDSMDGNSAADLSYNADGTYRGTIYKFTRDENGNITSTTAIQVEGTWSVGDDGEVYHDSLNATGSTTTTNGGGESGDQQSTSGSGDQQTASGSGDEEGSGGDDKKDDNKDTTNGEPASTTEGETADAPDTETEDAAESEPETSEGTPMPEDLRNGGGTGLGLTEKTAGRLGGEEARRVLRGIGLQAAGGGTVDPNPEAQTYSGVLLTPEERKNAERALGMARGGGFTDPTESGRNSPAITDRDLRNLGLKGTGGAMGPREGGSPTPPPQDPHSPIAGPLPSPRPSVSVEVERAGNSGKLKENIRQVAPH